MGVCNRIKRFLEGRRSLLRPPLVTKKIGFSKNRDKLVAKYKGIVPNYEKY
jgi:hypothetical protein